MIVVEAAAGKLRNRRIVQLPDDAWNALMAWWDADLKKAKAARDVNYRKRLQSLRKEAGIETWHHDGLRHTAASHLCNLVGAEKTSDILRHSMSVLHNHYRALKPPEEARAFYAIR